MPDAVLCHTCRKTLSVRDFPVLNDFNRQHQRSLYVPNNIEAAKIIRETTEVDLDISELDKEIQGLQSILKELETQRKALERCRDEARSLLAPVRKLPSEVLQSVFDACSSSNSDSADTTNFALLISMNTAKALTLDLSQVCSVWREIVRARPSLWSSIWVDLSHRNRAFEVMEHYLKQSRDVSLTLFITAGDLDQPSEETFHESDKFVYETNPDYLKLYSWDVLNILFLSSRRWKDVTMNFSWAVFTEMSSWIDPNDHRFDQLECLILDWPRRGEDVPWHNFVSLFTSKAQSPRLRSLSLSEYEPQGNFPFCHITTLGPMRGWSTSGMIDALTNCHNVDSFTIILAKGHGTGIALQPLLIKARSLDIEGYFSSHQFQWIELLNSLIATQLENLTLRRLAGDHWQPSLLDFISRSRCPLQTLTLCDDIYIDQYLLQLLSLVPTLISLTMKVYAIDDDLFNGLVATAESSIIPQLQQFDLVYSYYGQTENGHLDNTVLCILAMAESRLQSSSSVGFLEQFSVKYDVLASSSWDLNSESLLRLRRLNEAGMKASITVVRTLT